MRAWRSTATRNCVSSAGVAGSGEVVLTADDRSLAETRWERIREAGGIGLSPLDDRHYGDVVLEAHAPPLVGRALRYRFEFAGDRLDAARASGSGADLTMRARATDHHRCTFEDEVSFVAALRAACEEADAVRPELALVCPR